MKVIVAGAGIGGLTAALSLHAAGIDVLVIDAAVTLRPLGVGINLMPHAVRELTELGLGDELAATGIPTAEHVHFDRHGNRIWGFASGLNIGYRWPQYSIHRGELQMILLDAVRARLGRATPCGPERCSRRLPSRRPGCRCGYATAARGRSRSGRPTCWSARTGCTPASGPSCTRTSRRRAGAAS